MKVYVLSRGEYEEASAIGAFSTLELAKAACPDLDPSAQWHDDGDGYWWAIRLPAPSVSFNAADIEAFELDEQPEWKPQ